MPGLLDLFLCVLIVVGVPFGAMTERRRLMRALDAGVPHARLRAYTRIIVYQWSVAAVLLTTWFVARRSLSFLGIEAPAGRGFGIAVAIAIAMTAFLVVQMRAAHTRPEVAEQVREAAASLSYLLPATPAEMQRFTWVGVTAGIVEELVFRGYFMWCIAAFAPMWVALVVSSLAFGIGHAYQGPAGIVKTGVIGLVMGGLYWLSGSIWVPMFVHAAIDVLQGRMVYGVVTRTISTGGASS